MTAPEPGSGARRLAALRSALEDADLAAAIVVPGPNMSYLTGLEFHLSERPIIAVIPVDGIVRFVVPTLEAGKLDGAVFEQQSFTYDDDSGPADAFRACLSAAGLGGRKCGVEDRRIRFLEMDLIAHSGAGPALWGADPVFATLRSSKDALELAAMRRAAEIAEEAFTRIAPSIGAGTTEREAAARLTAALFEAGSDAELPFFPIVATGPNGALPHAVPTDRAMAPGDLVIFDWGARWKGYCSDITRTFRVSGATPVETLARAYEAVQAANAAGRAAARPGATGRDVDHAARAVIDAAGFGEAFVHRTGHGLGLETHEEPDMKSSNRVPLTTGETFTVEPGVYLEGLGGVRIEDDVVITLDGSETLTSLPRDLLELG